MNNRRDWRPGADGDRPLPPDLDPRRPRGGKRGRPTSGPAQRRPDPRQTRSHPGTALPARRRGGRAATVLSWIAVITSFSILATAGAGYALVAKYNRNIDRIGGVLTLPGVARPADSPQNSQDVLIVGTDSRANTGAAFQGTGANFVTGQRSDTLILAHLFAGSDRAELVSFPRDSWVDIPAYTDPKTGTTTPTHKAKINSAITEGGPALLVATIEQLTGIRIDHYVQIDFTGFTSMVDKLGGVEVCLSKPARESDSGINLPAGRQVIQGDQALAFVRQRKGLTLGDIDRIRRQQQFIGALIRKVLSAGTLLNPVKLNGFLDVATASLQVDEGLNVSQLRDLALRMRNVTAGGVVFDTVPTADIGAFRSGEAVVLLDTAGANQLFDRLRRDVPPDVAQPEPAPSDALTVPASSVRVQVFNGAGVAALGSKAAADLTRAGFAVIGAAGNRGSGATETVIYHGPSRGEAAHTLAAAVKGARVELNPTLNGTLEIVVGSSYSGVTSVNVAPTASAGPAPSTSPTATAPPVTTAAADPCAP